MVYGKIRIGGFIMLTHEKNYIKELKEAGYTPETFYDTFVRD